MKKDTLLEKAVGTNTQNEASGVTSGICTVNRLATPAKIQSKGNMVKVSLSKIVIFKTISRLYAK